MQGALNRVLPAFPSVQDTPEKRKALQAIIPGVKQDFSVLVPKLLEISIDSYATVLTEQELRDYLAFLNSPSGKSITQKGPLIARQAASAESPMIKAAMPGLMIKMADRICKVGSCKPEERARFRAEMDKAFPGSRR